ncbi:hypothetical protein DFH06DRAFT_995050 [Mycena polygramma]|nr:hypothetical protein DFH06DRAFT_995050 [Mycena polygramma]
MDGQSALIGAYLWRTVKKVVILRKNWRAQTDPRFTNLLARIREGIAWDGRQPMTAKQRGTGANYVVSDYETIQARQFHLLPKSDQERFQSAPVIVATKVVRDLINSRSAQEFAARKGQPLITYKSADRFKRENVGPALQKRLWKVRSKLTKDSLGELPLVIGMPVIVTENIAIKASVVNGAQAIVERIMYDEDNDGNRYLKCVYVSIKDAGVTAHGIDSEFIPIFPVTTSFVYTASDGMKYTISRSQVPLLPVFAFVDYKVQGRSMTTANIDIRDCRSLQSVYVMLSRATSLDSLCILRAFPPRKIYQRLGEEFRVEFERLERLADLTEKVWDARGDNTNMQY